VNVTDRIRVRTRVQTDEIAPMPDGTRLSIIRITVTISKNTQFHCRSWHSFHCQGHCRVSMGSVIGLGSVGLVLAFVY